MNVLILFGVIIVVDLEICLSLMILAILALHKNIIFFLLLSHFHTIRNNDICQK